MPPSPLREITAVRQAPGDAPRRWFAGGDLELIVWEDSAGYVRRFQLAYDRGTANARVVEWSRDAGIDHHRVDPGEAHSLDPNGTPILLAEPTAPPSDLAARFRAASVELDPGVRDAVSRVLADLDGWAASRRRRHRR